ncbi:Neprilysin-1 [Cryptotermes secundus]|uniref:Neprilysin-1 n=1 Tax=Cryptotermes secundus TaxID=105785 RepID=A0A2J7RFD1_9NEOP|nr:neprilysin-1 [Cryptotermes secundus]PNF39536.1 Neprilysin-1 [Cryptotermes secundus]
MSAPVALLRLSVLAALTGATHGAAAVTKLDAKCLTLQCRQAASGVLSALDKKSNPCDDFYEFSCGHFGDNHAIPEGKLLWDNFQILQEAMDTHSRDILNAPVEPGEAAAVSKAKNMFAACMDTDSQDRRGLDPVVELLHQWGGWPVLNSDWTPFDWHRMGDIVAEFAVPFIFSISSLASLDNANSTAVYLDAPSLVLPSPLLFNTETPDLLQALNRAEGGVEDLPFTKYLVKMATLLRDHLHTNVSDETVRKDMADVVLYMQRLSKATQVLKMDNTPIGQRGMAWTIGQLDQWTKETLDNTTMDWVQFLQRAFSKSGVTVRADHPVIFLGGEKALAGIISFIEGSDPRVLANYVMSRLLVFLTPESSREMRDAAFEFYVQQGYITTDYPRWLYCVHKVQDYPSVGFSHAVAYYYKTNMVDTQTLEEAAEMVSDLRAAFHDLLAENNWMDDETRHAAVQKADAMLVLMGFPSWCDSSAELDEFYNNIEVSRGDHFGNVARLRSFVQATNLATLGKDRDRNEWTQSPLVVNAFYNSLNNRITFPVGMMDVPFFYGNHYITLLDYARIGAIVGHEITHGFDSVGRQYDQFGSAFDWWSAGTNAKFEERAQCFVKQYSSYRVSELNKTVDGQRTLRENIADNGGIREAYRAFTRLKTRRGMEAFSPRLPGLEQYSPDQLFFIGYASMWCRAETLAGLDVMLQKDSHSPNRFRVIGSLSNMAEFSEAFGCPLGSRMNPVNKCVLW